MTIRGIYLAIAIALLGSAAARCSRADDAAPPVHATTQSSQVEPLPGDVSDVYIDRKGAVIQLKDTGDAHASVQAYAAGQSNTIAGARVLLVDSSKRVWISSSTADHKSIEYFDGKTWATRRNTDLPSTANRKAEDCRFIDTAVQDRAGGVWLADGSASQGWWLHHLSAGGKWDSRFLTERTTAMRTPVTLAFDPPALQVGQDGLLYVSWRSTRQDDGAGASGFMQIDRDNVSEYFYPAGPNKGEFLSQVIPLPDGSVGFVRKEGSPLVVWPSSAARLPPPDLSAVLARLASASPKLREAAMAELEAMGPRVRAPLQALLKTSDDPELSSRIPVILDVVTQNKPTGVFGGRYIFSAWRPLYAAPAGSVFVAVKDCKLVDQPKAKAEDRVLMIDPSGIWSIVQKPNAANDSLALSESAAGRLWWLVHGGGGLLIGDGKSPPMKVADVTETNQQLAELRGVDHDGTLYLRVDHHLFAIKADAK